MNRQLNDDGTKKQIWHCWIEARWDRSEVCSYNELTFLERKLCCFCCSCCYYYWQRFFICRIVLLKPSSLLHYIVVVCGNAQYTHHKYTHAHNIVCYFLRFFFFFYLFGSLSKVSFLFEYLLFIRLGNAFYIVSYHSMCILVRQILRIGLVNRRRRPIVLFLLLKSNATEHTNQIIISKKRKNDDRLVFLQFSVFEGVVEMFLTSCSYYYSQINISWKKWFSFFHIIMKVSIECIAL